MEAYARHDHREKAIEMFEHARHESIPPYTSMIKYPGEENAGNVIYLDDPKILWKMGRTWESNQNFWGDERWFAHHWFHSWNYDVQKSFTTPIAFSDDLFILLRYNALTLAYAVNNKFDDAFRIMEITRKDKTKYNEETWNMLIENAYPMKSLVLLFCLLSGCWLLVDWNLIT
jgi:hypothetical protein